MDIKTCGLDMTVIFNGETTEQKTRARLALGILCVDSSRIDASEDGMVLQATVARGVTCGDAWNLLGSALAQPKLARIDQPAL